MAEQNFFLGRQPILDQQENIVAFELLFRFSDCLAADVTNYLQASASVIVDALTEFGIDALLGRYKGFINVNTDLLMNDALELLPRDKVVIELLEMIEVNAEVIDRCRQLNLQGFILSLDDHVYSPSYEPLYRIVDIIKIDILQVGEAELPAMVKKLRAWPVKLLAEKVETAMQYNFCRELGFDLFQGYYFAHPVVLKRNRLDISKVTLMQLLNQLLLNADIKEIEDTFRQNPNLTYNLLRLVNSVAIGLREKIKTLRHAIMVLGQQQLKRWILLALFAYKDTPGTISPLLEMAAMRGRLMELLAQKHPLLGSDHEYVDSAFMTGLLSLIDVLFGVAMDDIVQQLNLDKDIGQALLAREGQLGGILLLAEKIEQADFPSVLTLMAQSQLSLDHLLAAQLEAINWTNSLGRFD